MRKTILSFSLFVFALVLAGQPAAEKMDAARAARDAGRLAEAEMIYRSLVGDPALDADAREALAVVLSWQGKLNDAIREYRDLREKHPRRGRAATLGVSRCLAWKEQYSEALREAERNLETNPADRETLLLIGRIEAWAGRTERSLSAFRRLLAERPDDREAHLGFAKTLAWGGRLREAEAKYRSLLAEDPELLEARAGLAYTLIWQERLEEAGHSLEGLPAEVGRLSDVRLARLSLMRATGDRAAFRRELRMLRETPGSAEIQRLTRLESGQVGPHVRFDTSVSRDSELLESRGVGLAASVPVSDPTFLFAHARSEQLTAPHQEAVRVRSGTIGLDAALNRAFGVRASIGTRSAEGSAGGATAGAEAVWKPRENIGFSAGIDRDYAFYTPLAVLNEVRVDSLRLSAFALSHSRVAIRGSYGHSRFAGNLFRQERDSAEASVRWPAWERFVRVDLAAKGRYFRFNPALLGIGYFNPARFRQAVAAIAATYRRGERFEAILDGAYGVQSIADLRWEPTGAVGLEFLLKLSERVDLHGRTRYSSLSVTSGNFSDRSVGMGLLVRLD